MPSIEKVGDLALLLDRCKRQGRVDPNALNQIFQTFKSLINLQATMEERSFASIAEEYTRRTGEYVPTAAAGGADARGRGDSAAGVAKRKQSGFHGRDGAAAAASGHSRKGASWHHHKRQRVADDDDAADASMGGRPMSYNIDGLDRSDRLPAQDLRALLREAIDYVAKNDPLSTFSMEITDAIAPKYSQIVKEPMWIPKIRDRLGKGEYKSLTALDGDVELMFNNCEMFNGPASDYTKVSSGDCRTKQTLQQRVPR